MPFSGVVTGPRQEWAAGSGAVSGRLNSPFLGHWEGVFTQGRVTGSSRGQKRSEPAAHPCRGPGDHAGEWHGGPPWLKERAKGATNFV